MITLIPPVSSIGALAFHRSLPLRLLLRRPPPLARSLMAFSTDPSAVAETVEAEDEALPTAVPGAGDWGDVSNEEWRRWGTSSPLPAAVADVIHELLEMEAAAGEKMRFGGVGSKLKGNFKDVEDKKHRAVYERLADSDQKLQYFSARQIGCRLLGCRGYLCQKCWLPTEDCMCTNIVPCNLWKGMKFWLYMHPKDFLRQNNTGKLLWQVFGIQAAQLCLFGIQEHEDIMWNAFQCSGKGKISVLYPNKSTTPAFGWGNRVRTLWNTEPLHIVEISRQADRSRLESEQGMWDRLVDVDSVVLELFLLTSQTLLAGGEALSSSETSPEVEAYLCDLKVLAHRADHVLARFRDEALRRESDAGERRRRPAARKLMISIRRHFTARNPLLFRLTTAREMRRVVEEMEKLLTSMRTSGVTEMLKSARRKRVEADAEKERELRRPAR